VITLVVNISPGVDVNAPRAYRGLNRDERVEQRRTQLIETGLDCLHADGLSGVSVRSICARARLTPRYFYESFAGLDELLVAVVDQVAAEVATATLSAIASARDSGSDAGLEGQVRAAIDAGYAVVADDPRKATALLVAGAGHGPLRDRRHKIVIDYAELAMANLPRLGAISLADRSRARATALFVMGGAAELIEAVLSGALRLSRAQVVDLLTAMWVSVLSAGDD
jgi:AcrR family transcriptional regulator